MLPAWAYLLAQSQGQMPQQPQPGQPPGQPPPGMYPFGMTGGARVPTSVPPMFLPGQTPPMGRPGGPAAAPSPWLTIPSMKGAVQPDEHPAENQTGHSGAAGDDYKRAGKAPVVAGAPAAQTAPAAGGAESSPKGMAQTAGQRPGASAFGSLAMSPASMKGALTGILTETQDKNYLADDGSGGLRHIDPWTQMGQGEQTTAKGSQDTTEAEHQTEAVPDSAYGTAYNRMLQGTPGTSLMTKDVKNLRAGIGGLADSLTKRPAIGKIDLGPLMSLTDAWTGSNFAKTYRPPQTLLDPIANLSKVLGGAEGNLSQAELNLLKTSLADYYQRGAQSSVEGSRAATAGGSHLDPYKPIELQMQAHAQQRADNLQEREATHQVADDVKKAASNTDPKILGALSDISAKAKGAASGSFPGYKTALGVEARVPSYINDLTKDRAAQDIDQDNQTLSNVEMHEEFGARQTATEVNRMAKEMSTGTFGGHQQYLRSVHNYAWAAAQHLRQTLAGLTPAARAAYMAEKDVQKPEDFEKLDFGFGPVGSKGRVDSTGAPVRGVTDAKVAPGSGKKSTKEQLLEKLRAGQAK